MKIKTMNEMSKTENEAENRMNETENSQTEESESTDELSFDLIKEKIQEGEKSPNCLTKSPKCSRTPKLWINYMSYINILKSFIRAKRTGNLHLLPT